MLTFIGLGTLVYVVLVVVGLAVFNKEVSYLACGIFDNVKLAIPSGAPATVPIIAMIFSMQQDVPDVFNELKCKTRPLMVRSLISSLFGIFAIYFFAGVFGYLTFGGNRELYEDGDLFLMYKGTKNIFIYIVSREGWFELLPPQSSSSVLGIGFGFTWNQRPHRLSIRAQASQTDIRLPDLWENNRVTISSVCFDCCHHLPDSQCFNLHFWNIFRLSEFFRKHDLSIRIFSLLSSFHFSLGVSF